MAVRLCPFFACAPRTVPARPPSQPARWVATQVPSRMLGCRRRRNSRAQAEAAAGGDAAQQPTTVSQRRAADAEGERIMALPAEKQQEMSGGGEGGAERGIRGCTCACEVPLPAPSTH